MGSFAFYYTGLECSLHWNLPDGIEKMSGDSIEVWPNSQFLSVVIFYE
ncbi:MAG: hypothetical protein ACI9CE_002962 [Flavobacterium sp.]|jgi:hypothetical protein